MSDGNQKTVADLRDHLFAALQGLRDGTVDVEKARAMSDVAQTIINTAKVEIDYLRVNGGGESGFIDAVASSALPDGITRITRHRIKG